MKDEPSLLAYFLATLLTLLWTVGERMFSAACWTVGAVGTLQLLGML